MGPGTILVAAVAFGVIVLISLSTRVVQQAQTMIIERLGKYHKTLAPGISSVLPVIDRPRAAEWQRTLVTPPADSDARPAGAACDEHHGRRRAAVAHPRGGRHPAVGDQHRRG